MTLVQIFILILVALGIQWIIPARWRRLAITGSSLIAVALMFASTMPGTQAAIFYVLTVGITMLVWVIVQDPAKDSIIHLATSSLIGFVVAIGILLYGASLHDFEFMLIFLASLMMFVVGHVLQQLRKQQEMQKLLALFMIWLFVLVFVALKLPVLARFFGGFAAWAGDFASGSGLVWLGFSYFAFRLLAILFDVHAGRFAVQEMKLSDTITYALFFPSYAAGPIDRSERFISDLAEEKQLDSQRLVVGLGRIIVGVTKKFVIADTLALVSLNTGLIENTDTVTGLWLLVYAYAFQIYFDFSGYSDVAIGLGILLGIKLPENFDQPYLRPNIQQFWQNWHITLSTWFRIYFFVPFTRFMLQRKRKPPQWLIVMSAQIGTMLLIGFWHGITLHFLVWGLWHGLGLFIFKLISDNTRSWHRRVTEVAWKRRIAYTISVFITFHFVTLGWIFFALPNTNVGFRLLGRLFGIGGL